ncbi:DUF6876 family protein [Lacipirellula sp.]|uniref:DUF6876 family protein n=1 Tax=Lacipirellula sp. TaxID=2691419 RepID=UPI003D0B947F
MLRAELQNFTGDLERWRHPLYRKLIYTPGIKYLAERTGAFWLIDAIASWLPSRQFEAAVQHDKRIADIHFWKLVVGDDRSADLTAVADSGEEPFIRQGIEYADFPLMKIDLYCAFDGEHWTLMLPSEY